MKNKSICNDLTSLGVGLAPSSDVVCLPLTLLFVSFRGSIKITHIFGGLSVGTLLQEVIYSSGRYVTVFSG